MSASVMLVALLIDAAVGWPDPVFRRIGHPVTWIGSLIHWCDQRFNLPSLDPKDRRKRGAGVSLFVIAVATLPYGALAYALPDTWVGVLIASLAAAPLIAARSLYEHVADVARPLAAGDLATARTQVARIVGRDPEQLDAGGVARASLESLAENASDGVIAPLFWGCVFGLPGIAAYKAINTLDSMIGHRTDRHGAFGWFAANLDDWVNLIPARLTAGGICLVSGQPRVAFRVMLRDARNHRSPNAGWPEAAMAGGLGIRLSGPRAYADRVAEEPWLNAGAPDPTAEDLTRGLAQFWRLTALTAGSLLAFVLAQAVLPLV